MQGGDFFVTWPKNAGSIFASNSFDMSKTHRIHISKIFELVQLQKRFSITWVAEDGRKIVVPEAALTSVEDERMLTYEQWKGMVDELINKGLSRSEAFRNLKNRGFYSKGRFFRIVCIPSGEIRTVNIDAVIEFNGEEVFI